MMSPPPPAFWGGWGSAGRCVRMRVCADGTCACTVTRAVADVGPVSERHGSQRCQDGPVEGETDFTHIVLRAKERQALENVCAHICVHSRAWFHTRTNVCVLTRTCRYVFTRTHLLTRIHCAHTSMCAHMFQCTQVSMCVHMIPVHTRVCAHTPVYAHVYARFLCVHVSTCMFQCTHTCMFSCAYMCVPVCTPMCTNTRVCGGDHPVGCADVGW